MAQGASALPKASTSKQRVPTPGEATSGFPMARPRSKRDPVDTIWNLLCSIRFAVVLNVSLAVAAMLGTVITQMPPGIQSFDTELQRFRDETRVSYGPLADLLYWAGFFDLYNSLWFRMMVVIVVFGIIACTLNRWQPIMRQIGMPTVRVSDSFLSGLTEKAQFRAVPLDAAAAEEAISKALKRSRYRVLVEPASVGTGLHIYADRDRWSKLVTFVSHAALVLLIITAAGLANFGWREQSVFFYPGKPVDVGHGTNFQVRNDGFAIEYYGDGATVKEYKNTLAVIEGGREVLTKTIIVNDPLNYKGTNFFLVSYQPIVYAKATDSSGTIVPLREMGASGPITVTSESGEVLVDFNDLVSNDNQPMDLLQVTSGEKILTLEMTYYQDVARAPEENPPLYVRGFVDKEFEKPVYDAFIPRSGPLQLPGFEQYAFTFTRNTATVLEVAKDPGLGLVGTFFTIMAFGFTVSLYTTYTRCWAKILPSPTVPGTSDIIIGGLADKNKVSFERDFEKLATRAYEALAAKSANLSPQQDQG